MMIFIIRFSMNLLLVDLLETIFLLIMSLTYIGAINLCVLCVFVVRSTRYSLGASHFCKSTNWDFYGETLG